jgi:hypothetical protein
MSCSRPHRSYGQRRKPAEYASAAVNGSQLFATNAAI